MLRASARNSISNFCNRRAGLQQAGLDRAAGNPFRYQTTSYGAIARKIGHPDAARAVGAANGANPIALIMPCHRVIGSDGSLTGYGGGLPLKRKLLEHEARVSRNTLPICSVKAPWKAR